MRWLTMVSQWKGTHYNFLGADYKQFKTVLGSKEGHGAITLHSSQTGTLL